MNQSSRKKIIRPSRRIIFFYLLFVTGILHAQNYFFDQFSVSEGLAQSTVYSIIQDSNDYLWMGTQAGVSRFDGLEFVNYTAEDGLAPNGVRAVFEDSYGNIWLGHDAGGITRYNGEQFEMYEEARIFMDSDITSIIEDTQGRLWVTSTESGAVMIPNPDAPVDSLRYEQFLGNRLSDRVFSSYLSDEGVLYFVADPVVKYFNNDSSRFENLVLKGLPRYFAITSVLKDERDQFWFGTYHGGLYRYSPETDTTEMFDLIKMGMTSNWVSTLYEDRYENVWIGTWGGGVARISPDGTFKVFDERNGLPGRKIWEIMEDKEGNILLGTNENGLCAFKGDYFVSWFEEDGLINSQVWAIEQMQDGSFWIGTNKGISVLEPREKQKTEIRDFDRLKSERVRFINEDRNGDVWIGVENQGVFTYSRSGQFSYEPVINSNIPLSQVTAQTIDGENNLWVGTLDGLIYYEIDRKRMNFLTQGSGLSGNQISSLYADSKNRIWVGVEGEGITLISGSDFEIPEPGFDFTPTCFVEDRDGLIWVGTEGRGVFVYDPVRKEVKKRMSTDDGLLANLINLLNCDDENNIYIGTNKGLNKFIQSDSMIYRFTRKSGFVGIETKQKATCLDQDGNLWFGTVQGVTRYDPHLKPREVIQPLTHITEMMVNYKSYPMEEGMSLSHNQNSLIFDYRCMTLNPDAVQFQIMLEGIDNTWRPPGKVTQVTYPALPPGKYTFYVKAKNSDGVWNDPPVSFSFSIKPPFYLTAWFIISCIVAIGLIIFFYIKMRERALVRENRVLEDKVRIRTAEVVAQKEELAEKNKDITDSIRYAKRIQFAILPPESPFPETFILFKPKDIVSGDFYWFSTADGKEFLAAVDCTGHGVPGAFMSIIGHNSLNKIVNQYGILEPGKILNQLNREVVQTLHHRGEGGDVYDGMDIALIAYDPKNQFVEYAGAYNPLYLIRDGKLIETKADRVSIGRSMVHAERDFKTHRLDIQPGDVAYIFSDGYADQFGGELMKKFKYKNLKQILLDVSRDPIEQQRRVLDDTIEKWRGNVAQVDDILVIGRKF